MQTAQLQELLGDDKFASDIVTKKNEIERIKRTIATLETQRKDLAKQPRIGENSSYRIPLQRESMRLLQRKDAEIQEQTDALAKAEFSLLEFLRSLPNDTLPAR